MYLQTLVFFFSLTFILSCGSEKVSETSEEIKTFSEKLKTIVIQTKKVPVYHEVVGTINAKTSSILSAKISGHIKQINADEGSLVKEGDLLIAIDDRDVAARLEQIKANYTSSLKSLDEVETSITQAKAKSREAESKLALSKSTYERYQQADRGKIVSENEYDIVKNKYEMANEEFNASKAEIQRTIARKAQIKASIEQAKATVDEASVMKSYGLIKAPFNGVIVKKYVEVGTLAVPGAPLLALENPEGFRLEIDVNEKEFTEKVAVGCDVDVVIDSIGDQKISSKVVEIVPVSNPMSRTFKVKIALPELKGIKTGMYGKAICSKEEENIILIPLTAHIRRGQLEQAFVLDKDNIARLKLIKTGKKYADEIEILAGISDGDILIVNPKPALKDGNKVEVEK